MARLLPHGSFRKRGLPYFGVLIIRDPTILGSYSRKLPHEHRFYSRAVRSVGIRYIALHAQSFS